MEEAIEPLSQSLSMFLLEALLRAGNDSTEHTDPALEDRLCVTQPKDSVDKPDGNTSTQQRESHLCDSASSEITLSASVAKESVDPR